jgi:hypothetical protein
MKDITNFETIKKNTDAFYKTIDRVRCTALNNEYIHFTSEGFNHLMFKGISERTKEMQMTKFRFVSSALKLIRLTTTIQEQDECLEMKVVKMNKKKQEVAQEIKYWAFVGIISNRRIKAVVRQVGTGQKHFWSVIPQWSVSHYGGGKFISNAKGDLKNE